MLYNVFLTSLLVVALFVSILWKSVPKEGPFSFDKNFTGVLKGASAIIVVFVHVPGVFQNSVQRMVMSFGFVAVTIFFMISAYGMQYSINRAGGKYLSHFWRNRLASLLIPCFLINLFGILFRACKGQDYSFVDSLISLPAYVWVLLQYCLIFFAVMYCQLKWKLKPLICHVAMVLAVVASSLCLYLFSPDAENSAEMGWCYERMGLVWGLLLFLSFSKIEKYMDSRWRQKTIILAALSLVFGVVYVANKTVWFYGEYLLKIVLGLVIIAFILFLTRKRNFGNAAINHLGNISYEIYLSHDMIMKTMAFFLPTISSGTFLLLSFTSIIIFSTIVHKISSKMVSFVRA